MAAWPTLKEVRSLLRLQPDPTEDQIIQTALAAAVDYGVSRYGQVLVVGDDGQGNTTYTLEYRYPADTETLPDSGHQACLLHAARLYRRRDSIDGTLGFGETGVIRVGRVDADVEALYAARGPVVFG